MKVKTNLRVGAQNRKQGSSTDSTSSSSPDVVVYTPPVYRCAGV